LSGFKLYPLPFYFGNETEMLFYATVLKTFSRGGIIMGKIFGKFENHFALHNPCTKSFYKNKETIIKNIFSTKSFYKNKETIPKNFLKTKKR